MYSEFPVYARCGACSFEGDMDAFETEDAWGFVCVNCGGEALLTKDAPTNDGLLLDLEDKNA